MPMYLIGLGLGDEQDVTIKGAAAIRSSDRVFLEAYTSVMGVNKERLERAFGKEIVVADREMVESRSDEILEPAREGSVSFLVVGDALAATTHTDLSLRALDMGIEVRVIHNASIMNAVASTGLQLYSFGQTVSLCFGTYGSFYKRMKYNLDGGMHTLCLLDIKVKEPDFEALQRGIKRFLPPRFQTIQQAIDQILEVEAQETAAGRGGAVTSESLCMGVARVGCPDQCIAAGTLAEMRDHEFGGPLHSLVICGRMDEIEQRLFDRFRPRDGQRRLTAAPRFPGAKVVLPGDDSASPAEEQGEGNDEGAAGGNTAASLAAAASSLFSGEAIAAPAASAGGAAAGSAVEVLFADLSGRKCGPYEAPLSSKVADAAAWLAGMEGVAPERIMLIKGGEGLDQALTLADAGVEADDVLDFTVLPRAR